MHDLLVDFVVQYLLIVELLYLLTLLSYDLYRVVLLVVH